MTAEMSNPYYFEDGQGKEPDLVGFLMCAAEAIQSHTEMWRSWSNNPADRWLHPDAAEPIQGIIRAAAEHIYHRGSIWQPVAYAIQLAETILDRPAPGGSPNRDTPYVPRSQR